jgi:hypothetical protein
MKVFALTAALIGSAILAAPVVAAPMETLTVIYRSPLDYALYQQKAEMLGVFHAEHGESIRIDAHEQLNEMAIAFSTMSPLALTRISSDAPQADNTARRMTAPQ